MDDFCDINTDIEEGVETFFTRGVANNQSIENELNGLIALFKNIEIDLKNKNGELAHLSEYYRYSSNILSYPNVGEFC